VHSFSISICTLHTYQPQEKLFFLPEIELNMLSKQVLGIFCLLLCVGGAYSFYLPGVAPKEFLDRERVELKVRYTTTTTTTTTITYYYYCKFNFVLISFIFAFFHS